MDPPSGHPSPSAGADRAQSELLGLLLLMAITVVGITLILGLGASALDTAKDNSRTTNAEHAMTQFDSRTSLVALGTSDSQRVSIDTSGPNTELRADDDAGWMNVSIMNVSDGSLDQVVMNRSIGAIVYETKGKEIAYQGGGVWKRSGGNETSMISPPEFHYRIDNGQYPTLTLPLVTVSGDGALTGTLTIRRNGSTTSKYPIEGDDDRSNPLREGKVNVTVHSEYYRAWGRFFEERTDGAVEYDHEHEQVTLTLVVPSDDDSTVSGGLVSGASGSSVTIKKDVIADSYNSSEGTYATTNTQDTKIVIAGSLTLEKDGIIEGNLEVGGDVSLKKDTQVTGNVQYGDSLTLGNGAQIDGWSERNASVTAPDSVEDTIDEKRNSFASSNDNASQSTTISNIESGNCGDRCILDAGDYYIDEIDLHQNDVLTFDVSSGDVNVVVRNDITTQKDVKINVTGASSGHRANVYTEGDVTLNRANDILVPGDNSTQLWIFVNPTAVVTLEKNIKVVGVIYGPGAGNGAGADISLKKNGVVFGGLVGDIGQFQKDREIHYDEGLSTVQPVDTASGDNTPSIAYLHISTNRVNVTG